MEIILAGLLSGKVIIWQLILGGFQLFCTGIGGRFGTVIGFVLVIFWTFSKTYGDLLLLQFIIQGIVFISLFND